MLKKVDRVNILLDIYGELLSEQQREVMEFYYVSDYSLGEIAAYYQVSRQAVYDRIKRSVDFLERYEEKLGVCRAFHYRKEKLNEALNIIYNKDDLPEGKLEHIKQILGELYRENEKE